MEFNVYQIEVDEKKVKKKIKTKQTSSEISFEMRVKNTNSLNNLKDSVELNYSDNGISTYLNCELIFFFA